MIIRKRKLKISDSHTQEQLVRINKKYEKREKNREARALKAAQVERAIEKELLNRLKVGTFYKNIYNLDKKEFEEKLDEQEVPDQAQYEMEEELENEELDEDEDDSLLGDNLIDDEINDDERRMLEMAEAKDDVDLQDIENIAEKIGVGKKRQKQVKIALEDEIELEFEREDLQKGSALRETKKRKTQKSSSSKKIDW